MEWYEILIIVAAALFVIGVVTVSVVRKIQGKSGCGGNCSCCNGCSSKKTK